MVGAILFLGGETLHYFAMALTIGILFSIYSLGAGRQSAADAARCVARGLHQAGRPKPKKFRVVEGSRGSGKGEIGEGRVRGRVKPQIFPLLPLPLHH